MEDKIQASFYSEPGIAGESCKWYLSVMEVECGLPADGKAHIKTRTVDVKVPLCKMHLAEQKDNFARIRIEHKKAGRRG